MILLTMGFKTEDFLDQHFKTQNHFRNDQFSLSNSGPCRHTNFRLRAATPQIVAKHRRRRRQLSTQCGNRYVTTYCQTVGKDARGKDARNFDFWGVNRRPISLHR